MKGKIIIAVILILAVVAWGIRLYKKPHQNAGSQTAAASLPAKELYLEYKKDEHAADTRFLDKVLEVKGMVVQIDHTDTTAAVQLYTGDSTGMINCSFTFNRGETLKIPEKTALVTIKGRCAGFLMDVNLVDCVFE